MQDRSRLRHTGLSNTLGEVFTPDRIDATRDVITNVAPASAHANTRERLDAWPALHAAVTRNLVSIACEYVPSPDGLAALALDPRFALIEALHRAELHRALAIEAFVANVGRRLLDFEAGLAAVRDGTMTIETLGTLHQELVDGYHARHILPDRRGL